MKIGVLLVHGIGVDDAAWAKPVAAGLELHVSKALAELLGPSDPVRPQDVIDVEFAFWNDVVAESQAKLFAILSAARPKPKFQGNIIAAVKSWITDRLRRWEFGFVAHSVADIISYQGKEPQKLIHAKVGQAVETLAARLASGEEKAPLTIVSHSLGTVISSDFVWDRFKARKEKGLTGFHDRLTFANFFTVGSPIALFSLKYGGPEAFKDPVRVEPAQGRWLNIFDKDDPVGMPLRVLNPAYKDAVHFDVRVDAGDYLSSHMRYFKGEATLRLISRKIALDWAALNRKLTAEQLKALYAAYDQELGTP